jgi:hypothetical protein
MPVMSAEASSSGPDADAVEADRPHPRAGSPWWTPLAAVAGAALLALAAYSNVAVLALAVLVVDALLVWGWPVLLQLPAPRGTLGTLAAASVASAVAVATTRDDPLLDWLALAIAGGVIACFAHQLLRRDGRPRLVESLSGEVMAVALLASAAAIVALPRTPGGAGVVLVLSAAAAATGLVELVPLPERLLLLPAIVGSAAAGALAGAFADHVSSGFGAVAGLVYAVAALVVRRLFLAQPTLAFTSAALSLAVAPVAAGGILTYVLARLFIG